MGPGDHRRNFLPTALITGWVKEKLAGNHEVRGLSQLSELLGRKAELHTPRLLSDSIREKAMAGAEVQHVASPQCAGHPLYVRFQRRLWK